MNRLLFYHDFVSPFSRLAVGVAREAARRTGSSLRSVAFELRPAPEPLPVPAELDASEIAAARAVAEEWGLDLGSLRLVPRTRKAHEAVAYARSHDVEQPMVEGIYRALWQDGRDISRLDVLADIAEAVGLDPEEIHVALGVDTFQDEVIREQEAATAAGVTGVPVLQVRDVRAVGLFPVDEVVEWIESNR